MKNYKIIVLLLIQSLGLFGAATSSTTKISEPLFNRAGTPLSTRPILLDHRTTTQHQRAPLTSCQIKAQAEQDLVRALTVLPDKAPEARELKEAPELDIFEIIRNKAKHGDLLWLLKDFINFGIPERIPAWKRTGALHESHDDEIRHLITMALLKIGYSKQALQILWRVGLRFNNDYDQSVDKIHSFKKVLFHLKNKESAEYKEKKTGLRAAKDEHKKWVDRMHPIWIEKHAEPLIVLYYTVYYGAEEQEKNFFECRRIPTPEHVKNPVY